jgi:hypothetical protein
MEYRITWIIDLDADSPEDAARKALAIHRAPDSWATHFEVQDPQSHIHEVDLGFPAGLSTDNAVHVLVPMEDGIVRDVKAFSNEKYAQQAEQEWLAEHGLAEPKDREHASDWGTGIAIWECGLNAK